MVLGAVKGRAQARAASGFIPSPLLRAMTADACRDEGRPNGVDHASGGSNKGLSEKLAA